MEGPWRGSVSKGEQRGKGQAGEREWWSGKLENLHRATAMGAWAWRCRDCQDRVSSLPLTIPSQSPHYYQIILISAWHLGLTPIKESQSITGQVDQ